MKSPWVVFYAKKPSFFNPEVPTFGNFYDLYAEVRTVMAENEEEVFTMMQGENWSPNGEARPLIESLGLTHTSMSVGDVAKNPNGQFFMVESFGWKLLDLRPGVGYGVHGLWGVKC